MIGTGAMCDPYLHIEENLRLTRKCLELIDQYEYGVAVQTKSTRVLRDMDLLKSINNKTLCKILEPNVSTTKERFETLLQFKEAGIPTVVWLTPILPFINDTEENIRGILEYCVEAGVKGIICFEMGVTLRDGDREYFYKALDKHFPGIKNKYIRTYGNAYDIPSPNNEKLLEILKETCVKNGMMYQIKECFQYLHEFPEKYEQMSLFDI